ncbi:hypothetical protein [Marinobacter sp.]|uniref:hypothetical protein n=1 Tax=Marinobacter sp. TaxID=50741 RepID=UPI002B27027B|nr:hypothetical protein [Marinobacter sp.]
MIRKGKEEVNDHQNRIQTECSSLLDLIEQYLTDISRVETFKFDKKLISLKDQSIELLNDVKHLSMEIQLRSHQLKSVETKKSLLKKLQTLKNLATSTYHEFLRVLESFSRTKKIEGYLENWERLEAEEISSEQELEHTQSELENITQELNRAKSQLEAEKNEQIKQMV